MSVTRVVIVTGVSGSGKTTALRALEDLGFFSMDNLPIVLLPKVAELASAAGEVQRLCVVVDVREAVFLPEAGRIVDELRRSGLAVEVVFFDASDEVVLKRFSETRRRHPLDDSGDLRTAIGRERALLRDLRARADLVIDTGGLTVHELRERVTARFASDAEPGLRIRLLSFGFKYGLPSEADLVFDARFLANPHFQPGLREKSGLDEEVAAFVARSDGAAEFLSHVDSLLAFLLPRYVAEGKAYLTIAIGCTGGQHRSVAITEELGRRVSARGFRAAVDHRDRSHWLIGRPATG